MSLAKKQGELLFYWLNEDSPVILLVEDIAMSSHWWKRFAEAH